MWKKHRRGGLIGIQLLIMTISCGAAPTPERGAHQVSPVSVDQEDVVEALLGSSAEVSPVSADPEHVVEVLLGSSAEVSCQLQSSPAFLSESCISIQTKDTKKKSSRPLFQTDSEEKVEETSQVLLYLYKGQEKPKDKSSMYWNRTRRLRGGDGVEILSISASDNNTIIQCWMCYGCQTCVKQRELILRVAEKEDEEADNGNPTVAWSVGGVVVFTIIIISCVLARIIRKRAKTRTYQVAEVRQMVAVEMANGGVDRTPVEREGNQDHLNGSPGTTQHQQNGSPGNTQHQHNGSTVMAQPVMTQSQQNRMALTTQHQQNGLAMTTQQQENGSAVKTQHHQCGSTVATQHH